MAQDGQDERQDNARWRQDAKNEGCLERFGPSGGGGHRWPVTTTLRAQAPGRGRGGVNLWRFKDLKPVFYTPEAQGLGGLTPGREHTGVWENNDHSHE